MRCTYCNSDHTSLNWLLDHSLRYFCRSCRRTFEVSRGAVQSTAKPQGLMPLPITEGSVQV